VSAKLIRPAQGAVPDRASELSHPPNTKPSTVSRRSCEGVNRAGAGVGWVVGVELTFLEQGETGLFQCTARCAVVSLRRGDDDLGLAQEPASG
jgi:hypothetical protein